MSATGWEVGSLEINWYLGYCHEHRLDDVSTELCTVSRVGGTGSREYYQYIIKRSKRRKGGVGGNMNFVS